jgi:formylglycine-generating enzyme required for sulfatase activity
MALVPAGTLWLGSPKGRGKPDEHPEHKVALAEHCLDVREVTVAEYRACAENKACDALSQEVRLLSPLPKAEHAAQSALCTANLSTNADLPATCVSFEDASRYCAWKGRRLPAEAEWEWAATGGADQLAWPWGTALPSDANTCMNRRSPCRVASKPAGSFGLHDLVGGVREWTSSAYGQYQAPPPDSNKKVVRGGSWETVDADALRPEARVALEASFRDVTLGFRCAKSR